MFLKLYQIFIFHFLGGAKYKLEYLQKLENRHITIWFSQSLAITTIRFSTHEIKLVDEIYEDPQSPPVLH